MSSSGLPLSPQKRPSVKSSPALAGNHGSRLSPVPQLERTGATVVIGSHGVDAGVTLQLHRRGTTRRDTGHSPPNALGPSRSSSITPASSPRGQQNTSQNPAASLSQQLDDISGTSSPVGEMETRDVDARRIQHQYDQLRLKREVERMEAIGQQLRHRESLLKQFYEDVTLPVNDDLGIVLGQIRAVATELGSVQLDTLIDRLETAVEDQAFVLLTHMYGSNDGLIRDTEFAKGMRAIEQRRIRRKEAIERSVDDDGDEHQELPQARRKSRAPPVTQAEADEMLGLAASMTVASERTKRVLMRGSGSFSHNHTASSGGHAGNGMFASVPSFSGIPYRNETDVPPVSPADYLGAMPFLVAESIAKCVRCERVRVYLATDDGLGVKHITSFPPEPAAALPPALPRSLLSSVFMRGIAVSGFFSARESTDPAKAAAALADKTSSVGAMQRIRSHLKTASKSDGAEADSQQAKKGASDALGGGAGMPRCTLVYPIAVWSEGVKQIVGVIECLDKETGDDEIIAPGEPLSSASANSSANGKRFTARDEEVVFIATQLLGAAMERYPITAFYADASNALCAVHRPAAAATHLPIILTADIPGAAGVGNRSLRAAPWVHIYRGPMNVVHRHSVADNKKDVQGGNMPSSNAANDLRTVEESLDCLSAMWRRAYEDNVRMHQQCRRLHDEMLEMRRVTERFEESLSAARDLASIHDIHDYLRTVELSLKTGKARDVDKAIQGGRIIAERRQSSPVIEEASTSRRPSNNAAPAVLQNYLPSPFGDEGSVPTAASEAASSQIKEKADVDTEAPLTTPSLPRPPRVPTAPRRNIPLHELHYEGPEDVRSYTVDPESKRAQLVAIQTMVEAEAKAKRDAELRRLAAIPTYARPTKSASLRRDVSPFAVPAFLEVEAYGKLDVGPHSARSAAKSTPFRMTKPKPH